VFARVTKVRVRHLPVTDQKIQEAIALMRAVSSMVGHQGAIWLVDRSSGIGLAIDLYEDSDHLENTRQGDLRGELIEQIGGELISLEEYEVAGLDRAFRTH